MPELLKAVAYCRYSSHLQREESITAQLRAIEKYAEEHGYVLLDSYVDQAQSGKTDARVSFQKLMSDIKYHKIKIDAVIIHKSDRFARNRYDAAIYKNLLKQNNVRLISVLENLSTGNPETVIYEGLMDSLAEYYSLNLSREVRKGLKENALLAKATGGRPPLGYDIDPESKQLVINEYEAGAVRLIFKLYLSGKSLSEIVSVLNAKGYKTKRQEPFAKNSIHCILKNPKYKGTYIYNLEAPKYAQSGKPIRYAKAENDKVIIIENAIPAIISNEDFEAVEKSMQHRRNKTGCYNAKANYLLSGKIFCGECKAPYTGNKRKASSTHPEYISYRCSKRNGKNSCSNKEIRKEYIEELVLHQISGMIFSKDLIPKLLGSINAFMANKNNEYDISKKSYENKLKEVSRQINNLVNVITETGSKAVIERLNSLEKEKVLIENQLENLDFELSQARISKETLVTLFKKARNMFENGTLESSKQLIDLFVDRVDVYKERIEIKLNILPDDNPRKTARTDKNSDGFFDFLRRTSVVERKKKYD